ncbi:hypothetical protein [Streptomyces sp. NPDC048419]|uniref:hypothetical protein n=1 Tax=Streptomyces sp. NPDC048419 TaxID=3365547 RepID=UPI00372320D4
MHLPVRAIRSREARFMVCVREAGAHRAHRELMALAVGERRAVVTSQGGAFRIVPLLEAARDADWPREA